VGTSEGLRLSAWRDASAGKRASRILSRPLAGELWALGGAHGERSVTISEPHQIDIIAARPDDPVVKLIVSDHLDWTDPAAHALLLQEKLNTYLAFLEAGELPRATTVALPPHPEIVITLVSLYAPPAEASEFLSRVAAFLAGEGIRFEQELHQGVLS
jgi:hypothetical protein